jgi:hypothetical protein
MWHPLILYVRVYVQKDPTAFRVEEMERQLVPPKLRIHQTTRRHNPEDFNLNIYRRQQFLIK